MTLARLAFLTLLILGALQTKPASASTVVPADLSELAKTAKFAFVGTAAAAHSEWTADRSTIVTRTTFVDVVLVKGARAEPIEVTLRGGTVGKDRIETDGQLQFTQGTRYILLCTSSDLGSERNYYLPILGLNQGIFQVQQDQRTGRTAVHDYAGRPIASVDDGRLVVVASSEGAPDNSQVRPSAIDIDFIPRRGNTAKRDSVVGRAAAAPVQSRKDMRAIPKTRNRPAHTDSVPRVDWIPGSLRAAIRAEPVIRVVDSRSDPGTRLSEAEFIGIIKRLAAE